MDTGNQRHLRRAEQKEAEQAAIAEQVEQRKEAEQEVPVEPVQEVPVEPVQEVPVEPVAEPATLAKDWTN